MNVDFKHLNIRKNVVFSIASFLVNAGLVFISYRLVIIQGGIETVGLWSTLFAWTSLIRIGDVGMASASLRFAALCDPTTDRARLHNYIETGIITNAAIFLILTILGYVILYAVLPDLVSAQTLEIARSVLPLMMCGFYMMNLSGVIAGSMQGLHLGYRSAQLNVGGCVIQLICVVILVPHFGLAGMAWAQISQYAFTLIVGWLLVRRAADLKSIIPLNFSAEAFREMLSFSLKAQLANISNGLFEPVSKIMMGHFGGLQVLGIYELAYKTVTMSRSLPASGITATLPAMTNLLSVDRSRAKVLYKSTVRKSLGVTILLFAAVTACSPLIAKFWIGHIELRYSLFLGLLCVGFLGNSVGAPAYLLGAATGHMQHNIATAGASLAFLAVFGSMAGWYFSGSGVVFAVATILACAGWLIKRMNERLLYDEDDILAPDGSSH